MHRCLQFGMRENPASDRRHGSRFAVSNYSGSDLTEKESPEPHSTVALADRRLDETHSSAHAAASQTATGGEGTNNSQLLTVHEVAELLRVPVSWVYGRTRKRTSQRLPGYRLGKYWRFREDEIHAWVKRHCRGGHSA
jgi:excisionase family DNA binding protein